MVLHKAEKDQAVLLFIIFVCFPQEAHLGGMGDGNLSMFSNRGFCSSVQLRIKTTFPFIYNLWGLSYFYRQYLHSQLGSPEL